MIKNEPCTDNFYTNTTGNENSIHSSAFEFLETLKGESDFDFSIMSEEKIISSPESYLSSSNDDEFDVQSLISSPVNSQTDSLVSSFLQGNDNETNSKKRRREKKEEEVDPKKQHRLIKNRESAQASRERKKNYVKDLEGTVSNLTSNNRNLSSKVLSLEDENNKLREQLARAMRGEKVDELPPLKKPKIINSKLPLPPMQSKFFLVFKNSKACHFYKLSIG
jgi:hypothetical protein